MDYLLYLLSILLYFYLCYLSGKLAEKRALGFDHGLLISIFLTPLVSATLAVSGVAFNNKTKNWKWIAGMLVLFALVGGMLLPVPRKPILHETIRNLFYHVPMWFGMVIVLFVSVYYSIKYLSTSNYKHDIIAREAANTGLVFGLMGLVTGMIWGRFTWGAYWVADPKLIGAAITILIYLAYLILRMAMDEEQKRGRLAAVYNIFAFTLLIVFLFIYPRMTDSLHPGNGGNPAFSSYDLDNKMRLVFYPAVIGWGLIGIWIMQIQVRLSELKRKKLENDTGY